MDVMPVTAAETTGHDWLQLTDVPEEHMADSWWCTLRTKGKKAPLRAEGKVRQRATLTHFISEGQEVFETQMEI